ncbi:MAG: NADP oxidoreductase [Chloroflexi bacterium AL-W]|nr:NADP oxidoreductase [Chloroflexi bacterium AL-N1]NOK69119.1 NADP oxidoreductase [Chloroflexi bacterium AL-N10]NOK77102.1 NADP oxidoreductase [Chloroflexi bacterium AL-N5]NOK83747.1 NADP oxidoreductase [Chloroflexi bacterium AL-W]NOK90957.1 NADP oxidoreductase [Chloroflexi bacterium AL-N15]
MNIGIIGAGNIGKTLAKLLSGAGHQVAISNSRGPATLQSLVAELGDGVQAMSTTEAANFGDIIIEAIPFGSYQQLPVEAIGDKIFVTASNYYPDRDGKIELGSLSDSEFFTQNLTKARVVKAFNTIWYGHLATQGDLSKPVAERRVIFVAGDDADAKHQVSELIEQIGFGAVDTGTLHQSKQQQPDTLIYNKDMTVSDALAILQKDREVDG